jgi:UDP-glucose 4-epimerase
MIWEMWAVTVSTADPARDARTNILGGINVAQAAIQSECDQFTYITTGGALYGEPDYLPCDEDHPIRPISPYGLSKWTLEYYLRLLLPGSIILKVLRLANVYGPRQTPEGESGVISIFGPRMLSNDTVTIYGDGEQTRDFVYVSDVARAQELAQRTVGPLTVNIGSGQGTSVNQIFRLMADAAGYDLQPIYAAKRAGELEHSVLDNSRARSLLRWEPETSLKSGLRSTVDWLAGLPSA